MLQIAKLPKLDNRVKIVLTDSGGTQKKACILKLSCITLMYNTERTEIIEASASTFASTESRGTLKTASNINNKIREGCNF